MRRLNLLRKNKSNKEMWRDNQQKQIDDFNASGLKVRAAFPGSFIFNHILVPATDDRACHTDLTAPEVSDIVYANCSDKLRMRGFENTIVIDADEVRDQSVVDAILIVIEKMAVTRVVVLGRDAFDVFGKLLIKKAGNDVRVEMVEPDWSYAVTLHNIYRQANTVVFVNSMRVLDAAYTGCECVLIADEAFRKVPIFKVLHAQLSRVGCGVLDEAGQVKVIKDIGAGSGNISCQIVENSVTALDRALYHSSAEDDHQQTNNDWLLNYLNTIDDPVIKSSHLPPSSKLSDLLDRKTRVDRKIAKLRDDPRAFFSDSDSGALRFVARTLWAKNAQG